METNVGGDTDDSEETFSRLQVLKLMAQLAFAAVFDFAERSFTASKQIVIHVPQVKYGQY